MWIPRFSAVVIYFLASLCFLVESAPQIASRHTQCHDASSPSISISNLTYSGNGCVRDLAPGTVEAFIQDSKNINITYPYFWAIAGSAIPSRENIKFCDVTITLNYPAFWVFEFDKSIVSGTISLGTIFADNGTVIGAHTGSRGMEYSWTGHTGTTKFTNFWEGPYYSNLTVIDEFNSTGSDPNLCSSTTSQTVFTLKQSTGVSYHRQWSAGLEIDTQLLVLNWKKCSLPNQ